MPAPAARPANGHEHVDVDGHARTDTSPSPWHAQANGHEHVDLNGHATGRILRPAPPARLPTGSIGFPRGRRADDFVFIAERERWIGDRPPRVTGPRGFMADPGGFMG